MKILVTIPHYYHFAGGAPGRYGSTGADRAARVHGLGMSISALHRLFGGVQTVAGPLTPDRRAANEALRAEIHVVVATCQDRHVLDELSVLRTAFEHHAVDCQPLELGFECHAVLRDRLGVYDYYCYVEDDLVLHDPWFFVKLRYFCRQCGNDALLQPNRFEFSRGADTLKVYIDGRLPESWTARFQDVRERPEAVLPVMDMPVRFARTSNPHAGSFCLNAAQMDHWVRQPYFLNRDVSFIGPLESAATLGIMQAFRVYKPALEQASFLEVQHWGDGWIRRFARRDATA